VSGTALYHFTCAHAAARIGKRGVLIPHASPLCPRLGAVVWLTDMATPDRWALGLTSEFLSCDRTEYRYRCAPDIAVPYDSVRDMIPADVRDDLEAFGQPGRWWICSAPTPAVRA
jgi:hypothetical protein